MSLWKRKEVVGVGVKREGQITLIKKIFSLPPPPPPAALERGLDRAARIFPDKLATKFFF